MDTKIYVKQELRGTKGAQQANFHIGRAKLSMCYQRKSNVHVCQNISSFKTFHLDRRRIAEPPGFPGRGQHEDVSSDQTHHRSNKDRFAKLC